MQGKAPNEINAILTERLACFLPRRARDLSAPIYIYDLALSGGTIVGGPRSGDRGKPCQGHVPTDREPLRNIEGSQSNTLQNKFV